MKMLSIVQIENVDHVYFMHFISIIQKENVFFYLTMCIYFISIIQKENVFLSYHVYLFYFYHTNRKRKR